MEHFCCVKMKVNDPPYGSVIFLGSACYWQLIGSYVSKKLKCMKCFECKKM